MKITRSLASAFLVFSIAAAAWAQTPAATPPAKEVVVVGRLSIASLDALSKTLTELGVPNDAITELREGAEDAPFLGKGALAMDKPLGMVVIAAAGHRLLPIMDSVVIAMPVVAGKVTETDLRVAGGKAVEGSPGTFSMEEFIVRRAADYLFVKQEAGPFGLAGMPDAVFAPDYKDGTNLLALSANMDLLRKTSPDSYKDLAKNILELPRLFGVGNGGDDTAPVTAILDKVDKFTLAIGQDEKNLHLKSWLAPSPVGAKAKESPRPAFPAGMIVQMHLVYPTPEAAGFVEKQLAAVPDSAFGGGLPAEYHQRVKDLVLKAVALNSKADAVSLGFAMKDGHPVLYLVDQFNDTVDAGKQLTEIAEKGVALASEAAKEKISLDRGTYDAGGKKVQRLTFSPADSKSKVVVDEVQDGKVGYITISDNTEGKYVGDLAAAGMKGTSSMLCAGAVDLSEAVTAGMDVGGLPPDMLQKMKAAVAGQAITWTVQSSDQNFLYTDVSVPKAVIRELIKSETSTRVGGPVNVGDPFMP